jgi:hypothetical protein
LREESEKEYDSMHLNDELDSIETDDSDWHREKQNEQRDSTFRGITIDLRVD